MFDGRRRSGGHPRPASARQRHNTQRAPRQRPRAKVGGGSAAHASPPTTAVCGGSPLPPPAQTTPSQAPGVALAREDGTLAPLPVQPVAAWWGRRRLAIRSDWRAARRVPPLWVPSARGLGGGAGGLIAADSIARAWLAGVAQLLGPFLCCPRGSEAVEVAAVFQTPPRRPATHACLPARDKSIIATGISFCSP